MAQVDESVKRYWREHRPAGVLITVNTWSSDHVDVTCFRCGWTVELIGWDQATESGMTHPDYCRVRYSKSR